MAGGAPLCRRGRRRVRRGLCAGRLHHWNAYFVNSLHDKNWDNFLFSLLLFGGIALWTMVATMAQFYFGQMLILALAPLADRPLRVELGGEGPPLRLQFAAPNVDNAHLASPTTF